MFDQKKDPVRRVLSFVAIGCVLAASALADELRPWPEYRAIMWIGDTAYKKPEKLPLFFQRLREMGINAAMVHHDAPSAALLKSGMPFYVENMVNKGLCLKWNSNVRDWDKMVTAWKDERSEAGLARQYSFDDPSWKKYAHDEMQRLVRINRAHSPLLYDIRDELSVTMSANPFDYDFSPPALDGFRTWLKEQYGTLEKLNAQWDTDFADWKDVRPFTTDQIKNRMAGGRGTGPNGAGLPRGKPDWQALQKVTFDPAEARKDPLRWNFSPWCDHRTYMDISLARTLGDLRAAARELDPRTPVGIEGTQMPAAFGGYDLWRLSQVLDWVEPYDIGNAREIFGSFMPGRPILSTVGEQDARAAQRRLWHLLLEGDAGCIVWWSEDCIDFTKDDYPLTPRAAALAPVLRELQSPLARLFFRAEREVDPIAIHYSQPSIQVDWLLESTADGSTWLRRFSSYEAAHNRMAQRRQAWVKLLQDAGYTPRFISSEQIERGELKEVKGLVLSSSLALSQREADEILKFADPGEGFRLIVGEGTAGTFDLHGDLRTSPALARPIAGKSFPWFEEEGITKSFLNDGWTRTSAVNQETHPLPLFFAEVRSRPPGLPAAGSSASLSLAIAKYLEARATPEKVTEFKGLHEFLWRLLGKPAVKVEPTHCIRTHRYKLPGSGTARLLAFERNIVWQMGEDLKQRGGNEALEKPVTFEATLAAPGYVYELRPGEDPAGPSRSRALGKVDKFTVALDPWQPALYAVTPAPLEGDPVAALSKTAK